MLTISTGQTATDVDDGVCAPITLIFARGSTEPGTMGSSVGPALAKALISSQGASGVAIQGVSYTATIESNIDQGRTGGPGKYLDSAASCRYPRRLLTI